MADGPRVVVVGAGIAGLATAWFLRRATGPDALRVTVLEQDATTGGKIRSRELAGVHVETGPDTFLARVPWAADLCRELGLGDDLVAPATGSAYVWSRRHLRRLPKGLVLGVPVAAGPVVGSGILSPQGAARAALDLTLPATALPDDPSVAEAVGARLGTEALDVLVDPLIGGINAGRADRLSLRSTAPQLADALATDRSLVRGLRRQHRAAEREARGAADVAPEPLFLGVTGGLQRLIERLEAALDGVDVRAGTRAVSLTPLPEGGHLIACAPGPDVVADAVVLALPAFAAAEIVRRSSPAAAADLGSIEYASVVVAHLGYPADAVRRELDGSGFLVPRREGWLTTASTWSTSKWPALRRSGLVMLRASAGRAGDDRAITLDEDDLVTRLHGELDQAIGLSERPVATLVTRWHRSFPQYEPGHAARVERIESALGRLPGVLVTGAAYRGLGIAACVRDAERTADRIRHHLVSRRPSGS